MDLPKTAHILCAKTSAFCVNTFNGKSTPGSRIINRKTSKNWKDDTLVRVLFSRL